MEGPVYLKAELRIFFSLTINNQQNKQKKYEKQE